MILYVYTVHHYDFWLWLPNRCPTFFQLEFSSIVCSCCGWFKDDAIGCLHRARIWVCLKIAQCLVMFCYLGGNYSKKGKNIYILFSKYAEHFRLGAILCISSVGLLLLHVPLLYSWCFFRVCLKCLAKPHGFKLHFPHSLSTKSADTGSAGSTGGCSWQRDNGRRGGYTDSETCIEV